MVLSLSSQALRGVRENKIGCAPLAFTSLMKRRIYSPYVYTVSCAPVSLIVTFRLSLPIPGMEARARPLS